MSRDESESSMGEIVGWSSVCVGIGTERREVGVTGSRSKTYVVRGVTSKKTDLVKIGGYHNSVESSF